VAYIINRYTHSVCKVKDFAGNRKGKLSIAKRAYELNIGDTFKINSMGKGLWRVVDFKRKLVVCCRVNASNVKAELNEMRAVTIKKWYNRKTPLTHKKCKQFITHLYESKKPNERFYFITLTTKQHETGFTDSECNYKFGLWAKNRTNFQYVCIVERQRDTGDIHYHLVARTTKDFDIRGEVSKCAKLFNVEYHPALFDVSRVTNIQALTNYLRKYFTKAGTKFNDKKPPYSSLFKCRTLLVSKGVAKSFKTNAYKSIVKVDNSCFVNYQHLLVEKFKDDFFTIYQYNLDIWKIACEFRKNNKADALARSNLSDANTQNGLVE